MACCDTTILIDAMNRKSKFHRRAMNKLKEVIEQGSSLATTRFNVAELYVGVARSFDPMAEAVKVSNILENFSILEFDESSAILFGQIVAHLQKRGKYIGDMDALIASTTMAAGEILITRNPAHFKDIPNLTVESY